MARRVRGLKSPRAWLDDALGELACDVVGEFLLDPDAIAAYRASRSRLQRRKTSPPGVIKPLLTWHKEDGGIVTVLSAPVPYEFAVTAEHPKFRASVAIAYDVDTDEFAEPVVVSFEGEVGTAGKCVRGWIDELDIEVDRSNPFGLPMVEKPPPAVGEPRLSAADREAPVGLPDNAAAKVRAIATRAAAKLLRTERYEPAPSDLDWMGRHPHSLPVILESYVAVCVARPRDEPLIAVHQQMLLSVLEFICYQLERGRDWAATLVASYEARIIALANEKIIRNEDWFFLPTSFARAGIPISDDAAAAFVLAGVEIAPQLPPGDLSGMMRDMVDRLSSDVGNPFALCAAVQELSAALPPMARADIVRELARSTNPVAREAVPLLLLANDPAIRNGAVTALEEIATPGSMAPASLRRTIIIRNWIPQADRPAVDRVIRTAREKGVAIAPWPRDQKTGPASIMITASMIDGVDAQSIVVTSRFGRTGLCGLILLKGGVRDITCSPAEKLKNINENVALLRETAQAVEVDRACLDLLVQHAIATGLARGVLPHASLLDIAERISASDWKDRAVDPTEETARLFASLEPEERAEAAIAASLRRSEAWTRKDDVFDTWYEDDAAALALVARAKNRDVAEVIQLVLDEVMEKQRGLWAERALLMALWARSAKDMACHARWKDYLILAHCLSSGRALADIPLMRTAAEMTLEVARRGVV